MKSQKKTQAAQSWNAWPGCNKKATAAGVGGLKGLAAADADKGIASTLAWEKELASSGTSSSKSSSTDSSSTDSKKKSSQGSDSSKSSTSAPKKTTTPKKATPTASPTTTATQAAKKPSDSPSTTSSTPDSRANRSTQRSSTPSTTPTVTVTKPASSSLHQVQRGENLSSIATDHNISGGWHALFDMNRAVVENAHIIFPGDLLRTR